MESKEKVVIISDIHNRVDWIEEALRNIEHDKVIFLGDYFDDFHDTPKIAEKTANWLKHSLSFENRVHLIGNHDAAYTRSMNDFARCPGFDHLKNRVIHSIIDRNDWSKLKFATECHGWLLSHAGAHESIFSHPIHGASIEWILNYCDQGMQAFSSNIPHPSYQYSAARGMSRNFDIGGITWLDWNHEFKPIENLNQIVGHTICTKFIEKKVEISDNAINIPVGKFEVVMDEPKNKCVRKIKSKNWNIDCNNKIIAFLIDGEFSWIPNKFLK